MKFDDSFWKSDHQQLFLNPRLPEPDQKRLSLAVANQKRPGIIWLKSSGTESGDRGDKLVALSKKSFLVAASSANHFFSVTQKDCWLNPLPIFHVGGLSVYARAYLSGARVIEQTSWSVFDCIENIKRESVTITSMVPTQIYDLVEKQQWAPSSLRFVLVGGGAMDKALYQQARQLGWPLIPSYGMTETCAVSVAAPLESLTTEEFPPAKILGHVQFYQDPIGVYVEGESLFEGFLWVNEKGESHWQDRPRPFYLDDRIVIDGDTIQVLGRQTDLVKILGETVNLKTLTDKIHKFTNLKVQVVALKHDRKGYELWLAIEGKDNRVSLAELNQNLLPYERIQGLQIFQSFPRTTLGKINVSELRQQLNRTLI